MCESKIILENKEQEPYVYHTNESAGIKPNKLGEEEHMKRDSECEDST